MMEPPVFYKPLRKPIDVADHLGLARKIAVKYGADRSAIDDSWQYAEALMGLSRAALDFRPKRGFKFSTLAFIYMKRQVLQGFNALTRDRRAPENFAVSLATRIQGVEGYVELGDTIPDPKTGAEPMTRETRVQLACWLRCLDYRRRRIVRARYLNGETLRMIGDREGICRERVRQILEAALDVLRRAAGVEKQDGGTKNAAAPAKLEARAT